MSNTLRIYYYISSLISLTIILIAILNIKNVVNDYYQMKQKFSTNQLSNCTSYLIWKISLFINIFFLFASSGFLGYLIYKRNSNYDRVIFIRVGPTVDIIILIFLMVISFKFGPCMLVEIFLMMIYFNEIMHDCKNFITDKDLVMNLFVPYFMISSCLSLLMISFLFFICTRRCDRMRLMRRRNISIFGELMDTL